MVGDQHEVYSVSNGIYGAPLSFRPTRDKSRNYSFLLTLTLSSERRGDEEGGVFPQRGEGMKKNRGSI